MISRMETGAGLTLFYPQGTPSMRRIPRGHQNFDFAARILASGHPDELTWSKLNELFVDKLAWLLGWAEEFGMGCSRITERGSEGMQLTAHAGSISIDVVGFGPLTYLSNLFASGGSLPLYTLYAGRDESQLPARDTCLYVKGLDAEKSLSAPVLLERRLLPFAASKKVDLTSAPDRSIPGVYEEGLAYRASKKAGNRAIYHVVRPGGTEKGLLDAIIKEPMTLANGQTYSVYERLGSSWAIDESSDSLAQLRATAKAIQSAGGEARIVNHITGRTATI